MSSSFNGIILSGLDGIFRGFIMEHANATIARTGATPVTKAQVSVIGKDAMLAAGLLVNEVIAHTIGESRPWAGYARRVIGLTTDGRVAFLDLMAKSLKDMKRRNAEVTAVIGKDGAPAIAKEDSKMAGVLVGSATVYISQLNTIAGAFNNGGTINGLITYVQERNTCKGLTLDDVAFSLVYEYSKKFSKSKAGAPVKSFAEKLAKFLESNNPDETDSDGFVLKDRVVALLSSKE
jgi:hypothetical protein